MIEHAAVQGGGAPVLDRAAWLLLVMLGGHLLHPDQVVPQHVPRAHQQPGEDSRKQSVPTTHFVCRDLLQGL